MNEKLPKMFNATESFKNPEELKELMQKLSVDTQYLTELYDGVGANKQKTFDQIGHIEEILNKIKENI